MYMYLDTNGYHISAYKGACPNTGHPLNSFSHITCFIQNRKCLTDYSIFTEFLVKGIFLLIILR